MLNRGREWWGNVCAALVCVALVSVLCAQWTWAARVSAAPTARKGAHTPQTTLPSNAPAHRQGRILWDSPGSALGAAHVAPPGPFPFQTAMSSNGLLIAHYYSHPATFVQQVLSLAQNDLRHPVQDTLGFTAKRPINIYIYDSRDDFLKGAPIDNAAETGALTDPTTSSIYLVIDHLGDQGSTDDLPHELTHAVFHQNEDVGHLQGTFFEFFPLWLDEGLATYDETEFSAQVRDDLLRQATTNKRFVNLLHDFTNEYPADPNTDDLAYAEAHSFITYLANTYGLATLRGFVASARDGNFDFDALQHFGADLPTLQSRWATSLGLPPTVADQGYAPPTQAGQAATPVALPALASQTRPFALPWQDALPVTWLLVVVLLLLIAMVQLIEERRILRPRGDAGLLLMLPNAAPSVSPITYTTTPPAADAPANSAPYAIPYGVAPLTKLRPPRRPSALDATLLLLPLPLAFAAGILRVATDPLQEWRGGYLAAALASIPWVLLFLWRALRGRTRYGIPRWQLVGLLLVVALVALPWWQATTAARGQAADYERRGAYALALRYYADSGESHADLLTDLQRVQSDWAAAALAAHDYATAVEHLRAAEDACDDSCRSEMHAQVGDTYLAWGDTLLLGGHFDDALTNYTLVAQTYAGTPAATKAQTALREVPAERDLAAALAAGATGNYGAMNAKLRAVVAQHTGTSAAALAPRAPEPVTGMITNYSGAPTAGDRLFFLAFASANQARAFNYDFNHDASAFKVATVIGPGGAFTVRLQPGYWYIPCWDDPSQARNHYFNAPRAGTGNDAFTIQPFTPANAGVIAGY
jgi:hypothetical protein